MSSLDKDPQTIGEMFSSLADRYDRANHWLSLYQDRRWRKRLVRWVAPRAGDRVLDVCTGTGDLALALARCGQVQISGVDIAEKMLWVAHKKTQHAGLTDQVDYKQANALALPYPDEAFEIVTIAFGLRNLPNYAKALSEMHRVLKPQGRLFVLEFSQPSGVWGSVYRGYLKYVLPTLGGWITGQKAAYLYLDESIRAFPAREDLTNLLVTAGFCRPQIKSFMGGIAIIHAAQKPA